jgi:hypothetical protein
MRKCIKNVPTNKLDQVFSDLKYEGIKAWAEFEKEGFWTIFYCVPASYNGIIRLS